MKKGFTLIELLMVVAIIGILSTIVIVNLAGSRAKSRDSKRLADIKTIQLSLELFYTDNGFYPVNMNNLYSPSDGVTTADGLRGAYLAVIPTDPSGSAGSAIPYKYSSYRSGGTSNCSTSLPVKYHLAAIMEQDQFSNKALNDDVDYDPGAETPCSGSPTDTAFKGSSVGCVGTGSAIDTCYDVTN